MGARPDADPDIGAGGALGAGNIDPVPNAEALPCTGGAAGADGGDWANGADIADGADGAEGARGPNPMPCG